MADKFKLTLEVTSDGTTKSFAMEGDPQQIMGSQPDYDKALSESIAYAFTEATNACLDSPLDEETLLIQFAPKESIWHALARLYDEWNGDNGFDECFSFAVDLDNLLSCDNEPTKRAALAKICYTHDICLENLVGEAGGNKK